MNNKKILTTFILSLITILLSSSLFAKPSEKHQRVVDHWTADRIASAIPRNMVIDKNNGLGYIMRPDGSLIPHGHNRVTELSKLRGKATKAPMAKPGSGGSDSTPPAITPVEPADGATIGASQRFAVEIVDPSGIRSATLTIIYPDGQTQNFSLANSSGDTWENTLSGFTDGNWAWRVSATDGSKGKGNSATEGDWSFIVDTNSGGDPGDGGSSEDAVGNSGWSGGAVQNAAGRILFEMPTNARKKRWASYVCSGTVATDNTSGRSVIITAAHCIYDDANKA